MTQLDIWRMQAFARLAELVNQLEGNASPADELLDNLIRSLSGLPARPAGKPPYMGIFRASDVADGRDEAIMRLFELQDKLTGEINATDGLVDALLRVLSHLPPRPADKPPYASLFPEGKIRLLTADQLLKIVPEAASARIATLVPYLNRTLIEFDIITPLRQAHFLAQVAHESDRFNALEEYASGEDYEGREDLGNVYAGDGVRYKGRGLIQITGRSNYDECGRALHVDLVNHPTRLADSDLACRSAGWYWDTRKLNPDADNDDVNTITYVINGGYNGLDDRIQLLQAAKQVLQV